MPFKNAAPWLAECLKTIQFQTYTRWELLAVDDGSEDESASIVREFAIEDERISVLTNKKSGIISALQTGILHIQGEYITRMDADDLMPPDKLETLFNAAVKNPGSLVTGKVKYFGKKAVSRGYTEYEKWLNSCVKNNDFHRFMYRECAVASPNWLLPSFLLGPTQCFEELSYPEDYHLILKLYAARVPFVGIDKITHLWRHHESRTSLNSNDYSQQRFFELKINFWCDTDWHERRPVVVLGEGVKADLTIDVLERRGIHFTRVGLTEHKGIKPVAYLDEVMNPQILITVWPATSQRISMIAYLLKRGWIEGDNFWFL